MQLSLGGGVLGCRPDGGYLGGMHMNWGFLSVGLQFGGVISGGYSPRTSLAIGYSRPTVETVKTVQLTCK